MTSERTKDRVWIPWACVVLLALLCGVLGVLQYRWIGEVADAERERLKEDLRSRLSLLQASFNDQINALCNAFVPAPSAFDTLSSDQAYLEQYHRAVQANHQVARRIALAIRRDGGLSLMMLDPAHDRFLAAEWPAEWAALRDRLMSRLHGEPSREEIPYTLVEIPRLGSSPNPDERRDQEWLILELNLDYIRGTLLPAVLSRYLGDSGKLNYDAEVVASGNPSDVIYRSSSLREAGGALEADASVTLLETPRGGPGPGGPGRGERGPRFESRGRPMPPTREGRTPPPPFPKDRPDKFGKAPPPAARGAWILTVHHNAGSLEAIVAEARRRNLALSAGILLLIVGTTVSLMRLSSQRQRYAELQMNFVAGVSHELRTPLSVIRTAAFNLRGKLAHKPDQVERYGELIQDESEKLTALVQQVLQYGNARAGRVIRQRTPVSVEGLIENSLRSSRLAAKEPKPMVEKRVQPGLPLVLADQQALTHALQNLLDNAVKYATGDHPWIGVFAAAITDANGTAVEIRVADRGPGIPKDEREHIFDPFFRGRRALEDQVHGTGLGLSLVKQIVEAHDGTIEVRSEPSQGTEFVIRLPAAPPEMQDEFANSAD